MGCGSSRASLTEIAPQPVPQNQTAAAPEATLSRDELVSALEDVAAYLHKRKRHLKLVTMGGAVNTIHLQTRRTTHDVDFFSAGADAKDLQLLQEGMKAVRKQRGATTLPADWLNNQATLFIKPNLKSALQQEAEAQDARTFSASGLTLYAAPWPFAFVQKLHRMSGGHPKGHDAADAASYLHQIVAGRRPPTVTRAEIEDWLRRYQISISPGSLPIAIEAVQAEYFRTYGTQAIV